jgi:hypothetical protein
MDSITQNNVQEFVTRTRQIAAHHGCLIGDVQRIDHAELGLLVSDGYDSEGFDKALETLFLNHLATTVYEVRGDNAPCVALLKETLTSGVVTVWVTSATAVPPHLKHQVCAFLSNIGSYMEIIGQGRRGMYRSTKITYLC